MTLISNRFIDEFRPGAVVPDGRYDAGTLADMLERGDITRQVTAVSDVDYAALKVAELRELADAAGIEHKGMKKADLIAALSA